MTFLENVKDFLATDTFVAGGGVATGFIAGDFTGNLVASKLGYEGDTALTVSAITKVATGACLYAAGMSVRGVALRSFLRFAGIGAVASVILDLINRFFPVATAPSAALKSRVTRRATAQRRTATRRTPARVIRPPAVAQRAPPQVQVEVEKPPVAAAPEAAPRVRFM